MYKLLAVVIPSLVVGAAVVYFLPFGQGLVSKINNPTAQKVLGYKVVQIALVGFLTSLGIHLFTVIARSTKLVAA